MTKVLCCYTGCKYNSACCVLTYENEHYCKKDEIELNENERTADYGELECFDYTEDEEKPFECFSCQVKKRGYITLHEKRNEDIFPDIEFTHFDEDIED